MNISFFISFIFFLLFMRKLLYTHGNLNYLKCNKIKYLNTIDLFAKRLIKKKSFPVYDLEFSQKCNNKKSFKKNTYLYLNNLKGFHIKRRKLKCIHNWKLYCSNYDAKDIVILEGLEAVRKRPGMYIGNTDVKGLHQILFEIIDNSVDEYNNYECNEIKIVIHNDDSVTIEDNGRGIPCDIHEKTKKSALETVLTVLHSGAKFFDDEINEEEKNDLMNKEIENINYKDKKKKSTEEKPKNNLKENLQKYKYSSGLHGVGLSVANALSSYMKVVVFRNNKMYSIELEKGKVIKELSVNHCPINKRGTRIHYKPDSTIFKSSIKHNSELIKNRIHQLAYLNNKLTFYFFDERNYNKTNINISKENKSTEMIIDKKGGTLNNKNDKNININTCKDDLETINECTLNSFKNNNNNIYNNHYFDSDINSSNKNIITDYNTLDFYNYEIIKHEGGLNEYIEYLTKNKSNLFKDNKTICISCYQKNIYIDLKMRWINNQYNENIISFVNNVNTIDGGTHVDALKYAISRCINFNIKKNETKNFVNIPGEYIREGLTAILSIKMNNPEFEGQTKTKLGSHYLKPILESIIFEKLSEIFDFEPNLLNVIYMKALQAKNSDEEAKAARDLIRSKNNQSYSTVLPGKLVDCISDDISKNEIFIVEGDSAAGSAKQARNREIQAILPLKGKILNVEKIKNNKRIFENSELKSLITAIGLSVNYDSKNVKVNNLLRKKKKEMKKKYDLKTYKNENIECNNSVNNKKKSPFLDTKLRYGKIIIMTDADVDGEHIRILLLTFLYRFQKEIIENGNVYVACPPLYKITYNKFFDTSIKEIVMKQFNVNIKNSKFIIHTYSDEELNKLLKLLDIDKSFFEQKNIDKKTKLDDIVHEEKNTMFTKMELNTKKDATNIDLNTSKTIAQISNNSLFTFSKKYEIQRFKGLGEMMADQLWSTTMNPQVRKLIRVTVNDAIKANNLILSLMGEDSKQRKTFILENSNLMLT
ncbi:DNA gyrase subunit B, putative [Plasmodium gallinaceum]|uniref:DNA topoisomerase 2 n=1 Tax=Plasmodium gallinaceum TaxID=5849 RepID=A0A1J1GXQ8_PLAGA|nr:DNA gyrase subunit B, putative [Plasmodium gallinaceum]CRG97032.1 DNA gyrase subunit B, putative [Plasmodium gallinaceum]